MYEDILRAILLVAVFKVTNVFKWRTVLAYTSLSVLLVALKPDKMMPEWLLSYTFGIFAAYAAYGVMSHRIKCAAKRLSTSATPRGAIKISLTSLLSIFSIGYFFAILSANKYLSFFATIVSFLALGALKFPKSNLFWRVVFLLELVHSALFFGAGNLIRPLYYVAAYVIITRIFIEVRDAFSIACVPEELKEGMIPAETITWDGKAYTFGNYPYPSVFSLLRYATGDRIMKRRAVASFFSPLKKENISEIRKIAKKYKKNIFLVQKKIDFLPFLVLGTIAAYALA